MAFSDEQMLTLTMQMVIAAIMSLAPNQQILVQSIIAAFNKLSDEDKLQLIESFGFLEIINNYSIGLCCLWSNITKCISLARLITINSFEIINLIKTLPSTFDDVIGYTFLLMFIAPNSLYGLAMDDLICKKKKQCIDNFEFDMMLQEQKEEETFKIYQKEQVEAAFWESAEGLQIIEDEDEDYNYNYETMCEMFAQECLVDYHLNMVPQKYMQHCDFYVK